MPYGINSAIYLYMTQGPYLVIVGSCSNLMKNDNEYKLFRMFENRISSDVDMSNVPGGINSAIYYFVTQGLYSTTSAPARTYGERQ